MKRKVVKVRVSSTREFVRLAGRIFSPPLTDTEAEVLAGFVEADVWLRKKKVPLGAFSTQMRKKVAQRLGREDHLGLNVYIKKLKDKGAIKENDSIKGGYQIHPLFVPKGESEIVLKLIFPNSNGT